MEILDYTHIFEHAPIARDMIWPGFQAGKVGALIAPGGIGKNTWALQAAMAVSCPVPGGDLLNLAPSKTGKVFYLAAEDDALEHHHRGYAIRKYLPADARAAIAANFALSPCNRFNIMANDDFTCLQKYTEGYRLIVLDTLSRIHQLDENSNGDMGFLIARLELLASTTGAAVLYVHHTSKSSARDGLLDQQQAARGASALIDNARWCGYLARMTEDQAKRFIDPQSSPAAIGADRRSAFLRLGVSKQNNNAAPLAQWLERQEDGVLRPVTLQQGASKARDTRRLADGF